MTATPSSHRSGLTVMAVAASLGAFTLSIESPWMLAATLALCGVSWVAGRWTNRLLLPPRLGAILGVVSALGAVLLLPPLTVSGIVPAAGVATAAVLLFRLWTSRTASADLPVVHLSAVLLALAAFSSSSALGTIAVTVAVPLVISAVLGERIMLGGDRAARAAGRVMQQESPAFAPTRSTRRTIHQLTVALVTISSLVAVAAFVVFPRQMVRQTWWRAPARSGLSSGVDLSTSGPIDASRREVLRVTILDPSGARTGALGALYLRSTVADTYERHDFRWSVQREARNYLDTGPGRWTPTGAAMPAGTAGVWVAECRTRGLRLPALPMPQPAFAIQTAEPMTLPFHPGLGEVPITDVWSWSVLFKPHAMAADWELLDPEQDPSGAATDDGNQEAGRDGAEPRFGPAVQSLADQASASIDPELQGWDRARALAEAVRRALSQPPFHYTTAVPSPPGGIDPIEYFLSRSHGGHCELFASALVAACQQAGHDARVATGFLATEFTDGTQSYTVRESDAHAWPEIRVGPNEWRIVDPSPIEYLAIQRAASRSWSDELLALVAPVEDLFSRFVVGFDRRMQADLMRQLRDWQARAWDSIAAPVVAWFTETARWLSPSEEESWRAQAWLVSIGATIVAAGLALVARRASINRLRTRWAPTAHYRRPSTAVLLACRPFSKLHARLERACGPRPAGATLLQWIDRSGNASAAPRARLREQVQALYATRFGWA
ncbi:MAG: hypothetical protein O2819_04165 [Planctomycetota bacterium]|nr:hypothetical protein [Planctomycetota bacterium]MDA1105942.1 hypothetical protein [Planctomycetota bacterium]